MIQKTQFNSHFEIAITNCYRVLYTDDFEIFYSTENEFRRWQLPDVANPRCLVLRTVAIS